MISSHIRHPRLHALIGEVAVAIPDDVAREIECALHEHDLPAAKPAFFACLDAVRQGDAADGQPWRTRAAEAADLASLSRSLSGLTTLLELLHAAERARVDGGEHEQMGEFYIDGLMVAARQIARAASGSLAEARRLDG